MSLDNIQMQIKQDYGLDLSQMGIYDWIIRFTKDTVQRTQNLKLKVGNIWIADETELDVSGQKAWFWDIIDRDSRYLLASYLSFSRETEDAQILIEQAIKRAGKIPNTIITDKLSTYVDGIDIATHGKTMHIQSTPFTGTNSTNIIERFHGTLKDRTKVLRGFKDLATAQLITNGFLVHYNFIRPHESLENETPIEHMKVATPFHTWAEAIRTSEIKSDYYTVKAIRFVPIGIPRTPKQERRVYLRKAARRHRAREMGSTEPTMRLMQRGRKKKQP
ncbi:DDE-type integrase/transposase/recombinase [Patescibacteria group bacterium]|nr:DDE-type integrase/transposase/recombinase [Patescibacteria group bacterium]